MADFQRVVEFLRDFRASPVQTVTDEVRVAATDYAALCASANDRLRQCAVLLQRGLRAEAINLAEASPNLLDLVAALDLPGADRWIELCQRSDLPVPPTLQIERAAQLNDAYNQDQPLEELFATHRRLALSQAPVMKRLTVMRQIAQVDASPFWDKDIRLFESARFKELRVQLASALQGRDIKSILGLTEEVAGSPWLEPVPADLQTAARDTQDRVRLAKLDGTMKQIVAQLRPAFAARSVPQCAQLLAQAREALAEHGRSDWPVENATELSKIEGWVKQETAASASRAAFEAACDSLNAAIDADARDGELEALLRAAQAFGPPVPPELELRYAATLRRRSRAGQRKFLLGLAGIAAVLLIALAVGYSIMQARLAKGWALRIHEAAASHDLPLALQLIDEQQRRAPKVSDASGVAAAKREVAVLQESAGRENKSFQGTLAILDHAVHEAQAAQAADDADSSGTAPLDALRSADTVIEDALAQSNRVPAASLLADSRSRLAAAAAQLQGLRADLKARLARGVLARLAAISQKAEAVTVDPRPASLTASETALTGIENEIGPLQRFIASGTDAFTAEQGVSAKIAERRANVKHLRDMLGARQAIASRAGSSAEVRQSLEDFARRFPESLLSKDFLKAAAATDAYKSVEAWHLLSTPWVAAPAPPNDKAAAQRLDQVRGFLRDNPLSAVAPRASAYAEYLQQATSATAVENTWQTAMSDIFASPLIVDLKYLQTSDGARYFVLKDPNVRQRQLNDRLSYTFEVMDPQNLTGKKTIEIVPPVTLASNKPAPVPHAIFAQTVAEELKTVDRSNWDVFGIGLVSQIAAQDKIDIVVKAILLRDALQATAKVDGWAIGDAYDKAAGDLVRQRLDQVVWYDPQHPVPPVTIGNLTRIFGEVPKPAEIRQLVETRRTELFKTLRPKIAGIGMLLRNEEGQWGVETASPAIPGSTAIIIVPSPDAASAAPGAADALPTTGAAAADSAGPSTVPAIAAPATFVQVAEWKGKALVVDENTVRGLPEGTMVLLTRP